MPVHPGMVEDLSAGVRDLYADAEARLLGIIARQLAAGLEVPGWAQRKLADVQPLRHAAQDAVDQLATTMHLEVFDAIAEAYNTGARAGLLELGALHDADARRIAETTPNTRAVDRLATETIDLVSQTHRGILRGVEDGYRQVVAEVSATPLLGVDTRRQATQRAMERFADRGLRTFVDRAGRGWQMTSYAEMAVRTSVGRAAVEAHNDRLQAAGVDLVIVSSASQECPLCRPWEGKTLALSGPDGARTVEVEHAIDDGRMIRVNVAGTVDEARRAGLQHPNCRHSLSAFLPGVTRAPVKQDTDPDGYEASQKARANERGIRKWKARAAASTTPEGKLAAEAKVREWQKRQREHMKAHPELKRKRQREQPGAGNLPTAEARPAAADVDAARVRAGDDRSIRQMTDDQLAAAQHSGHLDQRDRQRIEVEAGRRDEQELLDRVRPDGRLADDLTPFADDDLARVFPHLDDPGALRVAAEMDRRTVGTLPGARTDLIDISDGDLAARARSATGDDLRALGSEAHRRELLAATFPDGRLTDDLTAVGDDVLGWAFRYARADEAERIAAELDRRYPPHDLPEAHPHPGTVDAHLADRDAIDEILAPAADPDDWGHLALDDAPDFAALSSTERWIAEAEQASAANAGNFTKAEIAEMHRQYMYEQWRAAEDACRGTLLNKRAAAAGVDPQTLFSGPAHVAYSRASDELKEWWEVHPRMTLVEYTEHLTGVRNAAAETARNARRSQEQKR